MAAKVTDSSKLPEDLSRLLAHPAVQAVLAQFPDAVIADVRMLPGFEIATTELYRKRRVGRAVRLRRVHPGSGR